MNTTKKMELVGIDQLIPYANNARTHSPEQITKLRSSLRVYGFVNPIIIDSEYNVLAGHGRLEAAKQEGMNEVPCVFVEHLSDAQRKGYILADNRMALDAGWDDELLRIEIEELEGLGFVIGLRGRISFGTLSLSMKLGQRRKLMQRYLLVSIWAYLNVSHIS